MGECVGHEPCPECGSRDNLARYADGGFHCFGCGHHANGDGKPATNETTTKDWTPLRGHFEELTKRGIREETCRRAGYQIGEVNGERVHVMHWRAPDGKLIAQKTRDEHKQFKWRGDSKDPPLYLQWLWPAKGKSITITEGEIDALTVLQCFDLKWPVVSLPNGCGSVKKALKKAYEFLDGYEKIVLMFDQDDAGREAVHEAIDLLPPGKVWVAKTPAKDANDTLRKYGAAAVTRAFWDAALHTMDGIVEGSAFTREMIKSAVPEGFAWRLPKLDAMTFGIRKGELTLLTAGSGIGKSTWAREIAYGLHENDGCFIGNIYLEEQNKKTVQAYVALDNDVPLGVLRKNPSVITDEQYDASLARVVHKGMWFYDHFGSLESEKLIKKITYLARVCKVDFVVLDHISIVTSGQESSSEGERKDIDILMTRLRQVVEATGIGIIAIVHLKRKPGASFNEGAQVSLSDLRGSGSLEQLSDNVYALERDQQADGDAKCKELIRVLKCRETGDTGEADIIIYDRKTGRLRLVSGFEADIDAEPEADAVEAF